MFPNSATANADVYSVEKEDTEKVRENVEHIHPDAVTAADDTRHIVKDVQTIKERKWPSLSKGKQIQHYSMPETSQTNSTTPTCKDKGEIPIAQQQLDTGETPLVLHMQGTGETPPAKHMQDRETPVQHMQDKGETPLAQLI